MLKWTLSICLVASWFVVETAWAQNATIQLPTFHYFTVATSVLVPDRGSTYLGGVKRARFGAAANGVPGAAGIPGAGRLFGNRAIGAEVGGADAHATATIMDLNELDRAVLAEAAGKRGPSTTDPAIARKAAFIARNIARTGSALEEPRNTQTALRGTTGERIGPAYVSPEEEARQAFETAQQAEANGHLATARINYKRAALLSRGKLRDDANVRLEALTSSSSGAKKLP